MTASALREKAARQGIAGGYHDIDGRWHEVGEETLARLLEAMGTDLPATAPEPVADAPCHQPPVLAEGRKAWGLSVQVYGLRSGRNWGIGDFVDLAELAELAARHGAAALQLSPLHALYTARPAHHSPYSPSSRFFLNPLYIDVTAVDEFRSSRAAHRFVEHASVRGRLAALRNSPRVDYPAVAQLKMPMLRMLFGEFVDRHVKKESERYAEFAAYRARAGQALVDFALFEALDRRLIGEHPGGWQSWPLPWRDRHPEACSDFLERHPLETLFPMYLQWLAHGQLEQAQQRACAAGMTIGLIADLAVGADPAGADAWSDRELLALDAEIGAPPDAFSAEGQAWGLAPWRPQVLAARGYQPWRALLDANLAAVGGLRIDHVIGCERQFWVPRGMSGRDGAYIAYPREALLAVLAERSRHHRALLVGEDLGTVPEGFSARMADLGILSTRVLRFERYPDGLFRRPETYPDQASACAGTHDLPPLAAWLEAAPPQPSADDERALLIAALVDAGIEPESQGVEDLIAAVHAFLAATPSRLMLVQLEDILAERAPANRPGTGSEQPNWQRKYSLGQVELADHPEWRRTTELLRRAGRASPP